MRVISRPGLRRAKRVVSRFARCALLCLALPFAQQATAALPRPVASAFLGEHIPLGAVGAFVQEIGAATPLFTQHPAEPMNPASTMKLVTTFAGLELLGPDYRWTTEAYADGPIVAGMLTGNLVLRGHGDPKITVEQFHELLARIRASGLAVIRGDLVLDRTWFDTGAYDPSAFDAEPLRPYNVGPDALAVNFKSVRFVFAPNVARDAVEVRMDPPMAGVTIRGTPRLSSGDCGDWHSTLLADFADRGESAEATFRGRYPIACGEREWYVALLDHPHYILNLFARTWADVGGTFTGTVRDGRTPISAVRLASLDSAPLYEAVRDINKLSNNLMARQLFLTLATTAYPPPATIAHSTDVIQRWLATRKLRIPELVLVNGSGLSRNERISAQSMGRLLLAADGSKVRNEYISSLAVAATDGTVGKRFQNEDVADQAFLKTGTLEGVRAIAGYVFGPTGRRFVVVCFVNHPNAARAQHAIDVLVQWVYENAR
jgi:D-alanyl-D-alanine carboxypeptidase/D-alanyl-D-alanine-endopeptidase (penicillin-binding protein 4)